MIQTLNSTPGQHLIFVQDPPAIKLFFEYVFNSANIDGQKIVWARTMGPIENRKLLDYYRTRQAWLFQSDGETYTLIAYPRSP